MKFITLSMMLTLFTPPTAGQEAFEKDVIKTSNGDLEITFIGHGSLMMKFENRIIHVDPYGRLADYSKLSKADLILITHDHPDHLDPEAIGHIETKETKIVLAPQCAEKLPRGSVMNNGDAQTIKGIKIEAVPAYNIVQKRDNGEPFHPKGQGNGYVLTFGDRQVYIAGDTENTPEMKSLKNIDIAFLPMNQPYTMSPEMVADAAQAFKPKILYPYHFGDTDSSRIVASLKDNREIEVRIRKMK